MSFWTAVVLIAALIAFVEVYKSRQGVVKDWKGNERIVPRDAPDTGREIAELKERLKVLERIATEDRETKALSTEIEKLRDQ